MNSVRHPEFVFNMVNIIKPKTYLELGLYMGETFEKMCPIVSECVGVDTKDVRENKVVGQFYKMTTDEFFVINKKTFDVIFIDADHAYESVSKDLQNSLKVLNLFGTIFLHDTDPIDRTYTDPGFCGDAYRILDDMHGLGLTAVTFPIAQEGITIVKRVGDRRVLLWT